MVNRDMEQHDKQRADFPDCIQCLKSTRSVNPRLSCHGTPDRWLIQLFFVGLSQQAAGQPGAEPAIVVADG